MNLEPKPLPLEMPDKTVKNFILHKFPAVQGREIVAKYPISAMPKVGDYEVSRDVMLKLMAFVGVEQAGGNTLMLSTEALINNHVGDWENLVRIEWAMLEYNCSFFANGAASSFLTDLKAKAPTWISRMLTGFSEQLLQANKQPSTS